MSRIIIFSILNFIHLFATVMWFGTMTANTFILLPSLRETMEASMSGKLLGAVMKRFRILVYTCIGLLVISGIGITELIAEGPVFMRFTNFWSTISSIKHIFTIIIVILAIYAFEGLGRKVSRLARKGPSAELTRLQKKQILFSYTGLALAIIILILTSILTAL
ncbi:MAG: hypothetical protein FJW66_00980 [Actinobacteria bacterium]|nr:hypothetical protein [Actinomycetota bacterium]